MPYYLNPVNVGVKEVSNIGDGTGISVKWYRAFPTQISNHIAYNIYMDVERPDIETDFFNKSPVFVSIDSKLNVDIVDLVPGQMYRFAVRALEYDPDTFDFSLLPQSNNLHYYPESPLREDIGPTDATIPIVSVDNFPVDGGVVKIGAELIQYSSVDDVNNDLLLTNVILQRGFNDTTATLHTIDGYDGYVTWDPTVLFFPVDSEEQNTVVFATQDRFDYPNYAFNLVDGYRQTTQDIVNTDLTTADANNKDSPPFDFAGYRRTDPVALFNGECVGSYFGGQMFCADGYNGVGQQLRGISVNDANTQRQEILLSLTGESVVLVRRQWTGIRCMCVLNTRAEPDASCIKCFGSGFVVGYSQFFNDKRSDSRIVMRFEPWIDDLPMTEAGLSPEATKPSAWTLNYPAIKKRDFIVRFDKEGNEEFRYEVVGGVGRNMLFNGELAGAQKLTLQRIRKTDQLYKFRIFRDTSTMPSILTTSVVSSLGIAPHSHTIVRNEKPPSTWNQISSITQGHSHILFWNPADGILKISEELGHSHLLVY